MSKGVTTLNLDLGQTIVWSKILPHSGFSWRQIPSGYWTHHSGCAESQIHSYFPWKALSFMGMGKTVLIQNYNIGLDLPLSANYLILHHLQSILTGTKKNADSRNYHPFHTWFQGNMWLQFLISAISAEHKEVILWEEAYFMHNNSLTVTWNYETILSIFINTLFNIFTPSHKPWTMIKILIFT